MASTLPAQAQLKRHLQGVEAALRAGDMAQASQLADLAVGDGHAHPKLLTLAAYHQLSLGDPARALALAMQARELAPRDVDALNVLGTCLTRNGRPKDAIALFDAALRQSPGAFAVHFNKADALEQMSELGRARAGFERTLALHPGHAEALARLAHMAAQRGDAKEARSHGQRALALDPNQVFASFALALADLDDKRFGEARARVAPIAKSAQMGALIRAIAQSLLGDALDGLGRREDAFAAYAQSGDALQAIYAPPPGAAVETALMRARRIAAFVERTPAQNWRDSDPYVSPVRAQVFLVSFPRSGTTLLEQVLAAHPSVQALDEKNTLVDSYDLVTSDQGLERLAAMGGAELAPYRAAYWARVAESGGVGGGDVFVDKMPLNSVLLCLIAKLFPDAKVLFALRDPRDVVFSCFRRRFGMTQQMYELLTLRGTAVYYDAVMALCELYREKLALPFFDLRYEDLVADFEGEARRLCAFLGLEYDAAIAQFAERSRARHIDTPSAAQVARGLYRQGVDQWRAYCDQLAPILPVLAPWVARFDYPET